MHRVICLLIIIIFIGCTADNPGSEHVSEATLLDTLNIPEHLRELENLTALDPSQSPQYKISFTPREIYGEVNLFSSRGRNNNIVSIDRNGRVYIIDRQERNIHVYNPDGELLSEIGREGRGPGEFLSISTIRMQEDRLMAYGFRLRRIQWFDLDSHDVNVVNLHPEELKNDQGELVLEAITSVMPLGNGSILIGGIESFDENSERERAYATYYTIDENGNLTSDEVFRSILQDYHDLGGGSKRIPSSDEGIEAVSPDGIIYHANTSEFLIHAINTENNTRKSIYYPYENAPLDRGEVLETYSDYLRSRMRNADFGDHWPALHTILADDENRIWVATITEDADTHTWWVLKDSGEFLGRFVWPRALEIKTIRNGSIYVLDEDQEKGVFTVQRHEIQMEPIN